MTHRHEWEPNGGCAENPGVYSSGGSVVFVDRCACGTVRRTDHWDHAQNRPARRPIVTYQRPEREGGAP